MASTDRNLTSAYRNSAVPEHDALPRRPLFSALRWGAILAGVVMGISVQLVLTLLGVATGLSATDLGTFEPAGASGPLLWAGISLLLSAFIGGYVAARSSGLKRKSDGVLHGATAWGATTLLFVILAGAGAGSMLGGMFGSMDEAMSQAGGANMSGSALTRQFGNVDSGMLERFKQHIQAGNRNEAIALLTGSLNMNPARAAAIVDQALIATETPAPGSTLEMANGNQAIQITAGTAWITFGALTLALIFGMGGGLFGASGARRMVWNGANARQPAT